MLEILKDLQQRFINFELRLAKVEGHLADLMARTDRQDATIERLTAEVESIRFHMLGGMRAEIAQTEINADLIRRIERIEKELELTR